MQSMCERLHAWETGSQAKAGVGRWITFYNNLRPHAAPLGPLLCNALSAMHGGQPPSVAYFNATQTDQQVQGLCCTNPMRDSSRESSMVAVWYE